MTHRPLPCYQRRPINNDDLIESIDRVRLKLANCLSVAESALDTLVQCRPPSDPYLSDGARETAGAIALPFGFSNAAAAYQHALRGKLTDQVAVQLPPTVNMLHLGQSPRAHLQTIPEETLGSESQGSTETFAETFSDQFLLPPFWGGAIFNVSIDSPPRNGETEEERAAREN